MLSWKYTTRQKLGHTDKVRDSRDGSFFDGERVAELRGTDYLLGKCHLPIALRLTSPCDLRALATHEPLRLSIINCLEPTGECLC